MRIAVVQHVDTGYFSEYISSLIDEAATTAGYEVKTYRDSIPIANQYIGEDAVVYILIETQSALMLKWWYNVKLHAILRKLKANIVIDLSGFASNRKTQQMVVFNQEIYEHTKALNSINRFVLNNIKNTISTAQNTIVCSKTGAEIFQSAYSNNQKTEVIYFSAPVIFKKFEWHEKILIKAMHAENNDYFLSVINDDAEEDFLLLLRAFSKFKKWQQSSMKFLLLPKYESFSAGILSKLATYKYREDVKLPEELDETALISVFASAHSLIHATNAIPDLMIISIALQCTVPIISFKNNEVQEYAGDAALYIEENNFESTGDALIKLYKDEKLHEQMKETAEKKSALLKREEHRNKLWQLIENAAQS